MHTQPRRIPPGVEIAAGVTGSAAAGEAVAGRAGDSARQSGYFGGMRRFCPG
jgi:hypothetical protein